VTRTDDWADFLDPSEPDPDLPAGQREVLGRVRGSLADPHLWDGPAPGLRAALLRQASTEAARTPRPVGAPDAPDAPSTAASAAPPAVPSAAPPAARSATPPAAPPAARSWRSRTRRAWWGAATGLAAAAALIGVLAWPRGEQTVAGPTTAITLSGTALAPGASAVADLQPRSAGVAVTLHLTGLKPAPAGTYYAAWLAGRAGVVPVGTFHWRKGGIPIDLWSGVGSDAYPELFVTLQHEGSPPTPSTQVVLSGIAPG
jgi:Anti-sigma-K factor rskA